MTTDAAGTGRAGGARRRMGAILGESGSVRRPVLFIVIALLVSAAIAPSFLTLRNLQALLVSSSFLMILAVGEAIVITTGMIDLGVQSVLASGGMLVAFLSVYQGVPAWVGVPFGLAFGAVAGLLVGLLVTRGRIPSFIVTLGTYWGFRGVALIFNGGNYISPYSVTPERPFGFEWMSGTSFGVSNLIWMALAVIVAAQVVMTYTPYGTWLKSIGSNEASARTVGINTDWIKISAFMVSGVLAVLAGVMMTAWQFSVYPTTGAGFSLQAIAGVILGGVPFTGGRGTMVGAAIGALIIGLIDDLIVLLGMPALYEYIIVAVILVIAGLQARSKGFVK